MVFTGINGYYGGIAKANGGLSSAEYAERALANGVAGGVLATMQGQRFGSGFASAGLSAMLNPAVDSVTSRPYGQGFAAAIVGGTVSEATGGKFANGAVTGAFAFAVGSIASRSLHDSSSLAERTDAAEIKRVAAAATRDANAALGDLIGQRYETQNSAALAWSDKVSPIADKYNTEIASRFFKKGSGYAFGSAVSDGIIKSVDPGGSLLKGGLLTAGYIHTHPTAALFSANDLDYAVGMYKRANSGWYAGGVDQSAFVAVRGGSVYRWSVNEYISSGGASWLNSSYYHEVRP